ncbi:MAG: ABC transporter substrate-binding protein [Chloroflexi bacterium]|nr:ABC transporter substrate-binding protein [Chloroflexota bacterium]
MADSSYWARFWQKRINRRRLLAGAGAGGLGIVAALACGKNGTPSASPQSPGPGTSSPTAHPWGGDIFPYDARRLGADGLGEVPPAESRGGTLRFSGFDALIFDTLDPHQTQFGPVYGGHSAVFSKILKYVSHEEQTIANDLTAEFEGPLDPEGLTYRITLRRNVFFHDGPGVRRRLQTIADKEKRPEVLNVAGRQLTAEDVKFNFQRQVNEDSPRRALYYRASQYDTIDKVQTPDEFTLIVTTKRPTAPFKHYMADTNGFIVPRELVDPATDTMDSQEKMIGSGPFMWDDLKALVEFRVTRNPAWFGWDDESLKRPYLDGYTSVFAVDEGTIESLFRRRQIDIGNWVTNPAWLSTVKDDMPELQVVRWPFVAFLNTRFKTYCPPYNDWRVRRAVHLATDRQQIIDTVWAGSGLMQGPVGIASAKWVLPRQELMALPGYRQGPERDEDLAEARQLYQAAGSPPLQIIFLDQPAYIPSFAPSYVNGLAQVLGGRVEFLVRGPGQIAEGVLRGCDQMPFIWGFDNGWIDLDDWVYPYFHSRGSKNSFKDPQRRQEVFDGELDALLDAQRQEFDEKRRRQIGFRIQRYLLGMDPDGGGSRIPDIDKRPAIHARLDYASIIAGSVMWPYLKNMAFFPYFGNAHWLANAWLDRNDPSYPGRPA